ncbi:digalactosyldiacylglycerol synthase 1, chloroplastic-like isoform X2 [Carex rostrata]
MEGRSSAPEEGPFAVISKGLREVRESATNDLQLIRSRASSFVSLADREISEFEFVKRIQPKITELRRTYSSAWEGWEGRSDKSTVKLDLSAIKKAFGEQMDGFGGANRSFRKIGWVAMENEDVNGRKEVESEPIQRIKARWKEIEQKNLSSEVFDTWKGSEIVEKVKLSLRSLYKEPHESKKLPPLDLQELVTYLVRQSGPFLDQLGVRRELCDKMVEAVCTWHKNQAIQPSLAPVETSSLVENNNTSDDLDLRIGSIISSSSLMNNSRKLEWLNSKRHMAIVTTASLPWMTGTAVNPLFRAAYLAKVTQQDVTLLVPWLSKPDQELVYPNNITFSSPEEQQGYIRNWLQERLGFEADFKISFYPAKFSKERRSIIPAGDTSQFIPSKEADIAILEEPEHLNWYHHGKRWTDKFNHVIGVVHTNYLEYIKREKNGALQAFLVKHINNWVTRVYCHKVLRLSAATQNLPKSVICNVHGVNPKFLQVGEKIASERQDGNWAFSKGAYFLGKMVWAKGYRELIDLLAKHKNELQGFGIDVYGSGEDSNEVQSTANKLDLNINFFKGRDHADDCLHSYKVFVNPSVSDVLCTATAEALAMGKFVICADHPSNDFFKQFPNCLIYKTSDEFVSRVKEAMTSEPQPLTPEQIHHLSWEAATQRFMQYSDLDKVLKNRGKMGIKRDLISVPTMSEVVDGGLAFMHYCLTGNEMLRLATGAIPGTRDYDKQHCEDLHLLPTQKYKFPDVRYA